MIPSNFFIADSSDSVVGLPRVSVLAAYSAPARVPQLAASSGGAPQMEQHA